MLPHLGLPDPRGDWHTIKAAIGKKADIVELVVNPSIPTPMRPQVAFNEMAVVPVTIRGSLWILFLLKPTNPSPTAGPEFFSLKLKRGQPNAIDLPDSPLPDATEWVFVPMYLFYEQMAVVSPDSYPAAHQPKRKGYPIIGGGTADHVRRWQRYNERGKSEVTEEEVLDNDIIDSDWHVPILNQALSEAANQGHVLESTDELKLRLRIHPAQDGDFRSIDYKVFRNTDLNKDDARGEGWKPLPPHATRPDGDRKFVNLHRVAVGKEAFSKEEWAAIRGAEQQQQQQDPSRIRARIFSS